MYTKCVQKQSGITAYHKLFPASLLDLALSHECLGLVEPWRAKKNWLTSLRSILKWKRIVASTIVTRRWGLYDYQQHEASSSRQPDVQSSNAPGTLQCSLRAHWQIPHITNRASDTAKAFGLRNLFVLVQFVGKHLLMSNVHDIIQRPYVSFSPKASERDGSNDEKPL